MRIKLADSVEEKLWFGSGSLHKEDVEASRSLASKLAELEGLRPFSAVVRHVKRLLEDENYNVSETADALERDPALTSRILGVANSAWYFSGTPCRSVQKAIVLLGADRIDEIVTTVALMGAFRDVGGAGDEIRSHSVATAGIARVLALELRPACSDGIFLCGLLHDIGKLLLMQSEEYGYARDEPSRWMGLHVSHQLERAYLGYDHAVLGGHVLSRWNIPEPIPTLVAWHHQPFRAYSTGGRLADMMALLRTANVIEPIVNAIPGRFDEVVAEVCETPDCGHLGLTSPRLLAFWEALYYAHNEALTLFGDIR